jgi:peptidoglycan/LPS O-acetylase OafA/YrhL
MENVSAPHKLTVLDALRGLAACAVVLFHRSSKVPFSHGYLAVDFFFMLSGFVLTFAYQGKLDSGWTTKDFLATRLARLYPLYLLGFVLGILVHLSDPTKHVGGPGWGNALMNLILLPAWTCPNVTASYSFPYNIPAWSLFLEILANICHALFLRRRPVVFLAPILLVAATGLIYSTDHHSMDLGAYNSEFVGGLFRLVFSYVMGIALCRAWKKVSWRPYLWSPVLAVILLLILAGVGSSRLGYSFDLIAVIGVFPMLLFLSASSPVAKPILDVAQELGATSYGVYILHEPVLQFLSLHGWSSPRGNSEALHIATSLCFVAGIFSLTALVDRFYDAPARNFLRKTLTRAPSLVIGGMTKKRR